MLCRRIIATLVIKNGWVVQSIGFKKYLPVGSVDVSIEFLNQWGIDEIVLLDIDATPEGREPNYELIQRVSKKNFVPLTVGGGIKNVQVMRKLIQSGADKISLNQAALHNPSLIEEAATVLGRQCLVVSMDVKRITKSRYEIFVNSGKAPTGVDPIEWSRRVEALGAGEILVSSIDRNGSKEGYDCSLIRQISDAVTLPVIASGGAGHPKHFLEGFLKGQATALSAGNFFHFTEHSVTVVKAFLRKRGLSVRQGVYANYEGSRFLASGRIAKSSESYLENLKYTHIPEEVI